MLTPSSVHLIGPRRFSYLQCAAILLGNIFQASFLSRFGNRVAVLLSSGSWKLWQRTPEKLLPNSMKLRETGGLQTANHCYCVWVAEESDPWWGVKLSFKLNNSNEYSLWTFLPLLDSFAVTFCISTRPSIQPEKTGAIVIPTALPRLNDEGQQQTALSTPVYIMHMTEGPVLVFNHIHSQGLVTCNFKLKELNSW